MAPEPGASLGVECVTPKKVLIPFTPVAKSEATGEKKKVIFWLSSSKDLVAKGELRTVFSRLFIPRNFPRKKHDEKEEKIVDRQKHIYCEKGMTVLFFTATAVKRRRETLCVGILLISDKFHTFMIFYLKIWRFGRCSCHRAEEFLFTFANYYVKFSFRRFLSWDRDLLFEKSSGSTLIQKN